MEIKARKSFHTKHKSSCYSSLGINDKSQSFYLPSAIMQDSFSIAPSLRCWICIVSSYMVLKAKKQKAKTQNECNNNSHWHKRSKMNWIKPRCWLIVTLLNLTPLELRRKKAEKQQIKMGSFSSSCTLYQLTRSEAAKKQHKLGLCSLPQSRSHWPHSVELKGVIMIVFGKCCI